MLAPDGIIVNDCPAQIIPLFTEIEGKGLTETLLIAGEAETQPNELVPVTEYVVFAVGDTMEEPLEKV